MNRSSSSTSRPDGWSTAVAVLALVCRLVDRGICALIARSQRLEAAERRRARARRVRAAAREARSAECGTSASAGILERRP